MLSYFPNKFRDGLIQFLNDRDNEIIAGRNLL